MFCECDHSPQNRNLLTIFIKLLATREDMRHALLNTNQRHLFKFCKNFNFLDLIHLINFPFSVLQWCPHSLFNKCVLRTYHIPYSALPVVYTEVKYSCLHGIYTLFMTQTWSSLKILNSRKCSLITSSHLSIFSSLTTPNPHLTRTSASSPPHIPMRHHIFLLTEFGPMHSAALQSLSDTSPFNSFIYTSSAMIIFLLTCSS